MYLYWHHYDIPQILFEKNDHNSLVVSRLRAFNVRLGYGGWKSCRFFVSSSIVCVSIPGSHGEDPRIGRKKRRDMPRILRVSM